MGKLTPVLPGQYLKAVIDQVRSHGGDVQALLARHDLSEATLDDPTWLVSVATLRELVSDALRVTREPALGLFVGQRLQANVHGALGYAALSSASIRQALDIIERYLSLRFPLLAISMEAKGPGLQVFVRETWPLGELRRPALEAVVMALRNVLDTASMGACRIGAVEFPFADPGYAPLARELLGCEVRYGRQSASFRLSAQALAASLRMADPLVFRDAAAMLEKELTREGADSATARVRRLLLEAPGGLPSLTVVARVLHLSPRTLHRRLVEEGTSFRALQEEVRHALALEYLKTERLGVEEIAFRLGYTEVANFRRAFKRWENVAPSVYRERRR
jgi:AraC-like DNA-binding protein